MPSDCLDSYDQDLEQPACCDESFRIARTPHRCCECHEMITPGKCYYRFRGRYAFGWKTYKQCMPCHTIAREMFCAPPAFGRLDEELHENLCWGHLDDPRDWDEENVEIEDRKNREWLAEQSVKRR